jgi:hypothetical protein
VLRDFDPAYDRSGSNSALGALLPHVRLAAVRGTLKAL